MRDKYRKIRPTIRSAFCATCIILNATTANAETYEALSARVTEFDTVDFVVPYERPFSFEMALPIDGEKIMIVLERVEIWAPGAVIKVYGADGEFETIAPPTANTYRGKIPGYAGSLITGGILPDGFHGMVRVPGRPTLELVPLDDTHLHALFEVQTDNQPLMTCDEPTPRIQVPPAAPRPARITEDHLDARDGGGSGARGATSAAVELAIEADVEYFSIFGTVDGTLDAMGLILANVNPAYESAADLTHVLTAAIVRTAEPDPYSSNIGSTLNQQQVDEWTTNQTDLPYDAVLLFTNKDTCSTSDPDDECTLVGRVFELGVVCDRSQAFAFTEFWNSTVTHAQIAGHELGHLWDARHCNSDPASTCFGTTPCLMMCSTINGCENSGNVEFGSCNAGVVSTYRANQSCFTGGPNGMLWVEWRTCVPPSCLEIGDFVFPLNTVREGVMFSQPGGFVMIKAGSSSQVGSEETFPLTIDTPVELRSFDGSATIGQ